MSRWYKFGLLLAVLLFCKQVAALNINHMENNLLTPHTHTLELKPIQSDGIKLAAVYFLPDVKDSEFGFGGKGLANDHNSIENCKGYTLKNCPDRGKCTKCPFNETYKLISCNSGFQIKGNACIPESCKAISSTYLDDIPLNKKCSIVKEYGLTCYKDCQTVICGDYPVECTKLPTNTLSLVNAQSREKCGDCNNTTTTASNCFPEMCKIQNCISNNYKVAADGLSCILKDDTCPTNYVKTCTETGIETTVAAQLTELGTKCYQCKPKEQPWEACAKKIKASYPSYAVLTSSSIPTSGSSGYAVVRDLTLNKLPGNKMVGAHFFTSISECMGLTRPQITIEFEAPTVPADGNNCIYAEMGGSCKYINVFNSFDFREFNIHYKITNPNKISYPGFYLPIYLHSLGMPSKSNLLKNIDITFADTDFKITNAIYAGDYDYDHSKDSAYIGNIAINIEGNVSISKYEANNQVPRIALRTAVLNIKSGATLETAGFDDGGYFGSQMIVNGTLKAERIGQNGRTRNMSGNTQLYLPNLTIGSGGNVYTNILYSENNALSVVKDGGKFFIGTLRTAYSSYIMTYGSGSTVYFWDPISDTTSPVLSSTSSSQKCATTASSGGGTICANIDKASTFRNGVKCCTGTVAMSTTASYFADGSADICGATVNSGLGWCR